MYLSAERVALVNHTIRTTFEQTCVAWQAIPHWDTGDPGRTEVSNNNGGVFPIRQAIEKLTPTVTELIAPTPDALLTKVADAVVKISAAVDDYVFPVLRNAAAALEHVPGTVPSPDILNELIDARVDVENAGFRAPSCLFGSTKAIQDLNQLYNGYSPVLEPLLAAGNIGSLYRINKLKDLTLPTAPTKPLLNPSHQEWAILLGRRERIATGAAPQASPGEEPVDLAVSIPLGFEIVGDDGANKVKINLRMRYAIRPKTPGGLVILTSP